MGVRLSLAPAAVTAKPRFFSAVVHPGSAGHHARSRPAELEAPIVLRLPNRSVRRNGLPTLLRVRFRWSRLGSRFALLPETGDNKASFHVEHVRKPSAFHKGEFSMELLRLCREVSRTIDLKPSSSFGRYPRLSGSGLREQRLWYEGDGLRPNTSQCAGAHGHGQSRPQCFH